MALAPKGFTLGFITGFGAGFMTRSLVESPREKLAPLVKVAMRAGVRFTERSREVAAHVGELLQDTFAEVRSDLKKSARAARPRKVKVKSKAKSNVINLHEARSE